MVVPEIWGDHLSVQKVVAEMRGDHLSVQKAVAEMRGDHLSVQKVIAEMWGDYLSVQKVVAEMWGDYLSVQKVVAEMWGDHPDGHAGMVARGEVRVAKPRALHASPRIPFATPPYLRILRVQFLPLLHGRRQHQLRTRHGHRR
jgi:hypothetical protein